MVIWNKYHYIIAKNTIKILLNQFKMFIKILIINQINTLK